MTAAPELPVWTALLVSLLVVAGAAITLIGSAGLWRLKSFYARVHAPTLGATLGTGGVLVASMLCFSVLGGRWVLHEVLIAVFLTVTTPVTLMLLSRATLHRDRAETQDEAPPKAKD
ncbi:putative K(+)/H(+) antiporter subunit G [Azorhizobium oxalatiphilum]|uniref:K(+)/H(+) antiporter subunit G n=1 Tax=Azorhizobium oxalatiphilum TaxID=980631 RepID=A0A917BN59_9HYPH|nr:monovalent cation/H(+) antiporter subunit G [Azorhizobium oxalatiphilum]GGF51286.1 putative K(+)/H(+) antiporter subunit G [Azorhizobium oxalatiphilum]